jgi:hypothetical protein
MQSGIICAPSEEIQVDPYELIMQNKTYLEAEVLPRKEGSSGGIFSSTSIGGVTGRCTKWVAARSMICF